MKRKIILVVVVLFLAMIVGVAYRKVIYEQSQSYVQKMVKKHSISVGETFYETSGVEGKLAYTITQAQVITDLKSSNVNKDYFLDYSMAVVDGEGYGYPNYLQGDNLMEGCALILLDVKVENENAVRNDKLYENTSIFCGDSVAYLLDTSRYENSNFTYYEISYCSLPGTKEHDTAYELQPGESTTFEIGYLVGKDIIDEQLVAGGDIGNLKQTFINLGLVE